MAYYIGLMSGTSIDGIDAVLSQINDGKFDESNPSVRLIETINFPLPVDIQQELHRISSANYQKDPIEMMGFLDVRFANLLAEAVHSLLTKANLKATDITAIGSHGQTIRHIPSHSHAFTLQIGDPNTLAAKTGITTVADFRRRDMAYGGQGAPLVPAFHQAIFSSDKSNRVILNLGGIANITILKQGQAVLGYDTGPANTLMDQWISKHLQKDFDRDGKWAASGKILEKLLKQLTALDYFSKQTPKSTGREQFNLPWLETYLEGNELAEDIQRTLLELSAKTISEAIKMHLTDGDIYICGGGVHNQFLITRLKKLLPDFNINSTQQLGVDPDWVEALAFAWLAHRTLNHLPGNLKEVTGASRNTILGAIYPV